ADFRLPAQMLQIMRITGFILLVLYAHVSAKAEPAKTPLPGENSTALPLFSSFERPVVHGVKADLVPIRGRITDSAGNPLAGINVLVKGTQTGTNTDNNGNFTVNADIGSTLIISGIGYETREVVA